MEWLSSIAFVAGLLALLAILAIGRFRPQWLVRRSSVGSDRLDAIRRSLDQSERAEVERLLRSPGRSTPSVSSVSGPVHRWLRQRLWSKAPSRVVTASEEQTLRAAADKLRSHLPRTRFGSSRSWSRSFRADESGCGLPGGLLRLRLEGQRVAKCELEVGCQLIGPLQQVIRDRDELLGWWPGGIAERDRWRTDG